MRANTYWKCVAEGCKDGKVYNFKGLCRSCTTYDKDGNVVVAVNRVKATKDGTPIPQTTPAPRRAVTLQDFKDFRRANKRLTNKQMEAISKAQAHTQAQLAQKDIPEEVSADTPIDTEVMPIGESLGEEE